MSLILSVVRCSLASHVAQQLAKSLAKHGVDTTVISDSAVFAMMARVNKVMGSLWMLCSALDTAHVCLGHPFGTDCHEMSGNFVFASRFGA